MKVALLIAATIAVACAASFEDATHMRLFANYMVKYNKQYTTEERAVRFENFKASLKRVAALNEKSQAIGGATYGVTKFSDMTPEEFRGKMLMSRGITAAEEHSRDVGMLEPRIAVGDLPTTFDWRDKGAVTPVKDQEQCGSCWAFSATENIESVNILAGHGTNDTLSLSPQQIVDCDTTDQGCNGGNPPTAYEYVISAGGLENITTYPYEGVDGQCAFQKSDVAASIASYKYATKAGSEDVLQQNLVGWAPLSICVDASKWQDYQSGVMTREECAWVNVLDHCVQLVGYNKEASKPYYIVRNSWNTNWGIEGYIWLSIGSDTCGLTREATSTSV